MNRLRALIRGFFGFSRTETNAFVIMLPMMALLVFSEPAYRWWTALHPKKPVNMASIDSLVATWHWKSPGDSTSATPPLFSFNPNNASMNELVELGMTEKIASRIVNYRNKGGRFRIKSDLGKIYGMDSSLMLTLRGYIDLPEKIEVSIPRVESLIVTKPPLSMDLNTADSAQLTRIRGIGPRLSTRIIKYRERLGGFVSLDQLLEVYGLDTAVIRQLKIHAFVSADFVPRLIPVNTAGEKQFTSLPYIKYNQAKALTAYRFQHGPFIAINDLRKIALLDSITFEKIKPYLTLND